jgi:hypothetical protein
MVSAAQEFRRRRSVCSGARTKEAHNGLISRRTAGCSAVHAAEIAHNMPESGKNATRASHSKDTFLRFATTKKCRQQSFKSFGLLSDCGVERARDTKVRLLTWLYGLRVRALSPAPRAPTRAADRKAIVPLIITRLNVTHCKTDATFRDSPTGKSHTGKLADCGVVDASSRVVKLGTT